MSLTLEIPDDVRSAMTDEAAKYGWSLEQAVLIALQRTYLMSDQRRREEVVRELQRMAEPSEDNEDGESWAKFCEAIDEDRLSDRKRYH